ncbi:MAG: hypothetical protein K2O17_01530 [Bacteroidaceae bacterium]|nr:hypothetical protein [Bacteroidaceae bacterium]
MKTNVMAFVAFLMLSLQSSAFEARYHHHGKGNRPVSRVEGMEKRSGNLADELGLTGDAKDKFVATYKAYRKELKGLKGEKNVEGKKECGKKEACEKNASCKKGKSCGEKKACDMKKGKKAKGKNQKKKLSSKEAKKYVEERFARMESRVAYSQKRLEVEKKYYAEFQKMLTPQQLVRLYGHPHGKAQHAPHHAPRCGRFGATPGCPAASGK